MTTLQPIKRQTLTSAVTESLRRRILSGEFADGQQLRQEALSNEYGVSRVPVREALRQLEAEGLIQIIDHKGALVSKLSLEDILELLEVRAMLECSLLKAAIPCQSSADHEAAQQTLREFEVALNNNDVRHWARSTPASTWRCTAPPPAKHAGADRAAAQQDRPLHPDADPVHPHHGARHEEHTRLLELCRQGKADEAAEFLRFHILSAGHALESYLKGQQANH
ncbi:Carbon starvation induced regulator [Chromobacterium violaceum]|uniref:Carbon starvation induced regulator n=1 Tax=Chromobacterium violaceum TaxID=536 RepID=A0A447TBJ9_CHRVL|nr:Carbon starvation induced regulator [Chromobacterium violaceum]